MSEHVISDLVVLPRRVRPQPTPNLNPGGDCGACVLAGLTGLSVAEVYAQLNEGKVASLSQLCMRRIVRQTELFDRVVEEFPIGWMVNDAWHAFGLQPIHQNIEWFAHVRMALDAGYYGIACVDFTKRGAMGDGTDHWVLLAGHRQRRPAPGSGGGRVYTEVLVSCSARSSPDEEWVDSWHFLRERGGFNVIFVRPRS